MSDKLNNSIGLGIAVLVGAGVIYGIVTWISNGNSAANIIIGALLLGAAIFAGIKLARGAAPFSNFKNDWQTLGAWIAIGILVVLSLMFLSGFGNFAS
jgi:hypothetical protein